MAPVCARLVSVGAALALLSSCAAPPPLPTALEAGPFIGHVGERSALLWAFAQTAGEAALLMFDGERRIARVTATSSDDNDSTLHWRIDGLAPGKRYRVAVAGSAAPPLELATPSDDDARAVLAFGSCASELKFPVERIWDRIRAAKPDAFVLLGDTPYIDTPQLSRQREAYRRFFGRADVGGVLRTTPTYATWDDHDFGKNDTDGNLPGRDEARRAFREYHANASCGIGQDGVFTSFRRGPAEVFLLDTRWFARTAPSPFDATKPTLLGAVQWEWLRDGLKRSTAPFKILACGMVWNGAVRPNKTDHWGHYAHELQALLELIGTEEIGGVILVGGDIHRTRVIEHATRDVAGYDLHELITSPLANESIPAGNVPHPGLLFDAPIPETFLLLEVERDEARARFVDADGKDAFTLTIAR